MVSYSFRAVSTITKKKAKSSSESVCCSLSMEQLHVLSANGSCVSVVLVINSLNESVDYVYNLNIRCYNSSCKSVLEHITEFCV